MCFIAVEDIDERLRKPKHQRTLGDLIRLELPETTDDSWPCITAVLQDGRCQMLWTVYNGRRDEVIQVLNAFNETLG